MWILVHLAHLVLSSATLLNKLFCCSFWSKIMFCLCAFHNSEMNIIPQPQEQKSCRRQTRCSNTYYLWMKSIIIPIHHYSGCNCSLLLFSKISHKNQSRTLIKIVTVVWKWSHTNFDRNIHTNTHKIYLPT